MKAMVCEMCNGHDIIKQNGFYVCQYCGTKYSVEEAKKMMIDGPVEVKGLLSLEKLVQNGETFLKLAKIKEAKQTFEKIKTEYPEDYRGWWGMAKVAMSAGDRDGFVEYFETTKSLAPKGKLNEINKIGTRFLLAHEKEAYQKQKEIIISQKNEEESELHFCKKSILIETVKLISLILGSLIGAGGAIIIAFNFYYIEDHIIDSPILILAVMAVCAIICFSCLHGLSSLTLLSDLSNERTHIEKIANYDSEIAANNKRISEIDRELEKLM